MSGALIWALFFVAATIAISSPGANVVAAPALVVLLLCFFFVVVVFFFLERGREEEREEEKHECVVASHTPPTGDPACNPGMCPCWESNWRLFISQASTAARAPS